MRFGNGHHYLHPLRKEERRTSLQEATREGLQDRPLQGLLERNKRGQWSPTWLRRIGIHQYKPRLLARKNLRKRPQSTVRHLSK